MRLRSVVHPCSVHSKEACCSSDVSVQVPQRGSGYIIIIPGPRCAKDRTPLIIMSWPRCAKDRTPLIIMPGPHCAKDRTLLTIMPGPHCAKEQRS